MTTRAAMYHLGGARHYLAARPLCVQIPSHFPPGAGGGVIRFEKDSVGDGPNQERDGNGV